MMADKAGRPRRSWLLLATGCAFAAVGLVLGFGGARLAALGGSLYYLLAGIALLVSGVLLAGGRHLGALLYLFLYAATWIWAVWEVGLDFWQLAPRVIGPTVLALVVTTAAWWPRSGLLARRDDAAGAKPSAIAGNDGWTARRSYGVAAITSCAILLGFAAGAMSAHGARYGNARSPAITGSGADGDWHAYGRTNAGQRFSPLVEITPRNVGRLRIAWTAHTGDFPGIGAADENTPLKIGDRLITCSPHDVVNALDPDNGRRLWSFDAHADALRPRCRTVGYFKDDEAPAAAVCRERILIGTIDARLIALDLANGRRCPGFGASGVVDLKVGMVSGHPAFYFLTSGPAVARGLVVVGGTVIDSADVDVPSGVVRAFDARTGVLRWYWDLGAASSQNTPQARARTYTRGTPNVWAPISIDERLGLVFLPTGNPSPDHWGGRRTPAMERFGSSVVALDLATGKVRWSFQTTHHDLWDYDVPAQPTLYDVPDGRGGRVPAVIQPTKRGEIFVLDRRTGKPVFPVVERRVPTGTTPGDRTAPTQPYPQDFPSISGGRLTEARMWGFSPLDQLWCRIAFRELRYEGDFTPPGTRASLLFPGVFGGMNWGGASIDAAHDYLIVNDIRLPQVLALVPRELADREGKGVLRRFGVDAIEPGHGGFMPQKGAPFAALYFNFMSPLGVPCQAPPWGTLTAIDLRSRRIAWQVPMGTARDTGPFGMSTRLPMPIGLPTIGGSLVTRSGLVFFAGTQDSTLRAIDSATGHELWSARMPVGAGATPMTYTGRTGRQYIVISASGARYQGAKGDRVIAYALP